MLLSCRLEDGDSFSLFPTDDARLTGEETTVEDLFPNVWPREDIQRPAVLHNVTVWSRYLLLSSHNCYAFTLLHVE